MNYKQNIVFEYNDISIKIDRLSNFLKNQKEDTEEIELLRKQLNCMEYYQKSLEKRLIYYLK